MAKIVVLGGGESGVGSAVLAKVKGFEVFLSDRGEISEKYAEQLRKWDIPFESGRHSEEKILDADEIIKSPGIPLTVPLVVKAQEKGIPIISEIEFAGRYDSAKKICITGSNGKTTTTSLIYYLLQQAGLNVGLGGNIGKSYAMQVATEKYDYYVLELSSFQLDNMYDFKADIAIITNITPDHLDRYDYNIDNYAKAKFRITRNMSDEDCFIFCSDDEITIQQLDSIIVKAKMLPFSQKNILKEGAWKENGQICVQTEGQDRCDLLIKDLALSGKHNVYNSMAAAIAGKVMNIKNEKIRQSLQSFKAVEHRLEQVRCVGGVNYIHDSKATNVDAAWYALECQEHPVVWIVGGTDKGNDYSTLYDLVKEKVKAIVCLGVDNQKIHAAFENLVGQRNIVDTKSAEEAVQASARFAQDGDTVLLSPCCASFDLFKNYEERGKLFKEAVWNL